MSTDVQTPFLGIPLVPLKMWMFYLIVQNLDLQKTLESPSEIQRYRAFKGFLGKKVLENKVKHVYQLSSATVTQHEAWLAVHP